MRQQSVIAALAALVCYATPALGIRSDPLTKPAIVENVDWSAGLLRDLHGPSWMVKEWTAGTITPKCKEVAVKEKQDPTKMTVYEVTYDDCAGKPWLLCRHADSQTSIVRMIDRFGRLPVRMRQNSKSQVWLPAQGGPWGYAVGGDIVYFGPADNPWIYLHEAMHASEWADAFNSTRWVTEQPTWLNAYNKDTHVVSGYARTNMIENLAENSPIRVFDKVVSGGIKGADPQWPKYANQQAALDWEGMNGKNGGLMFQVGGISCSSRYTNEGPVSASSTSRLRRWYDIRALLPGEATWESIEQQRARYKAEGITILDDVIANRKDLPERTKCQ